ncbi:response regulator transcription factor [Egicoccus halophilus]|uniref:DNA-binding response regulator n=1 Tax=Egicoccus halophilus TaxID=1670830 RepID=A0A8J3ADP6_9ACTN|nr:response regulator transcription factor [Egicoccus halophilus]GGI09727.1 DNA-binding response regulator [Egicoccus halophilus]
MHDIPARVLLVEDDDGIARPLVAALSASGHEVVRVATGREALTAARAADAVVLDLGLPDIDGVEVCRRLRRDLGADLPILVLTARTTETEVVVGLDAGADDYVTKPFRLAELQARLRALLRRAAAARPRLAEELVVRDVRVDVAGRRAWRGGRELDLSPKEFDLLALLVARAGSVVTREELAREVWDTRWMGASKTIDVHVSSLRRKLGDDPADPRYVTTVRGVGLRFELASEETGLAGGPAAGSGPSSDADA